VPLMDRVPQVRHTPGSARGSAKPVMVASPIGWSV
jgi:hypothetical protein